MEQKEGAMMELELPDASSDDDHKKTEKDEFSEYVIAPPSQKAGYVSGYHDNEGSPSPIVIKPDAERGNEDIKGYNSTPSGQPVRFKAGQEVVKIRPIPSNKGKIEIKDDNYDFKESPRKGEEKRRYPKVEEEEDEFGEYHQVQPVVAPQPEMDIPDDEFGEIVKETPAKKPLTSMDLSKPKQNTNIGDIQKSVPFVVSAQAPALYEIDIDEG